MTSTVAKMMFAAATTQTGAAETFLDSKAELAESGIACTQPRRVAAMSVPRRGIALVVGMSSEQRLFEFLLLLPAIQR